MSAKRRDEKPVRDDVRAEAMARAGHRCEAAYLLPSVACSATLDGDEYRPRSQQPGGHLDVDNVQILCRSCHGFKHERPSDAAVLLLRPPGSLFAEIGLPDRSRVGSALIALAARKGANADYSWVINEDVTAQVHHRLCAAYAVWAAD